METKKATRIICCRCGYMNYSGDDKCLHCESTLPPVAETPVEFVGSKFPPEDPRGVVGEEEVLANDYHDHVFVAVPKEHAKAISELFDRVGGLGEAALVRWITGHLNFLPEQVQEILAGLSWFIEIAKTAEEFFVDNED
jgi:hypothetical protein